MDLWDEDFREPTEDVISARRALSVAIALTNTRRPLSSVELQRDFYSDLGYEAFRKAFRRDRLRLAAAGMLVQNVRTQTGETAWQIDEESTFAQENQLTPEDSLVLDCLLLPLASDPSLPYSRDLRHALTKIDRSFDGTSAASLPASARQRNNNLTRIEDALTNRHAVRMDYTRADGSDTTRTVAPYGLFPLRDTTYLVAARLDDKGSICDDSPHTYNVDRIANVRELSRVRYDIPADFDVRDYRVLPFQLGKTIYTATLHVPESRLRDIRGRMTVGAHWKTLDEGATLRVEVSDEDAAASWALSEGVRPLEPKSLVQAWIGLIGSFLHTATDGGEA